MTPSTIRPTEQDLTDLDDAELLTLFRRGHVWARTVLHHRHAYMARRMVRHLGLRDPEEVTSRAVLIAIEAEPTATQGAATFRDLLFATIRRMADQAHNARGHESRGDTNDQEGDTILTSLPALLGHSALRGRLCAAQPLD